MVVKNLHRHKTLIKDKKKKNYIDVRENFLSHAIMIERKY